ncbi:MAG: GEVED domain-containing protein, partial [Bacteroidota bacterium]
TNIKKTSEVIFLGNNSSYGQIYPHKGTVIVQGTGSDIQGAEDSFNFAWRQLTGNFEIVAKLVSLQGNIDPWAKAGLMMRETLNSSSKNIFFGMASKNMDVYQRRNSNSGQTTVSPRFNYSEFDNKPIWLKMKRVDNTIYTEFSSDGVTWRAYRSEAVAMDCNVFVGLAVTAHNTKWKCTAAFDEVKVTDLQDAVACVCSSNGVSNQSLWIEKFQIGTSNGTQYGYLFNQTGKNYGYGDYYSFNLAYRKELQTQPGLTYPFTITAGSAPNMLNTKYYAITIDFNGDGDFDDPGEQVHRGGATGFITIPSWVKTAPMRMRVSVKFDSPADACERDFQGEVEDYGLSIVNPRNYCTPAVSNPTFFFKKIAVNNLERFPVYPASSSYTLVTQPTITACAGGSLNVSIQPGENMVTNGFTYVVTGFIDYNFDGDFADAGERIFEKVAYTSAGEPDHMYVNVAIPSNLSVSTRMRVSIIPKSSNYTADPCGGTRTTEDYVINIINDSPAVYSISAASICQGQNLMVNLSDTDAGTTYRVLVNNVGTNAILAGTGNATSISLSHEYFNNGDSISVEATKASGSKKMMSPNYIQAVVNGVSQIYDVLDQNPLQVAPNTSAIVRLNASETGANYFALVNGVVNGNAVAGTGNALTFTIPSASFSEGDIISVAAMKGVCNTLMNNSVAVSIVPCLGGGSTTESWIESITFNGRQITTGNNDGHADFTNNHLLTSYGLTGSITITPGFTASAVARYYKVWIDFNQDGDFNDVSELVASSTATASAYTKSFTIPAGAKPGITKLRISQRADSSSDPCYVQGQGEVEDYHVFIEPYCLPPGTGATTYIEHMKVGELTNVSGLDHGYGSYLYLSTTLKTGKNIPYKIVSSSTAPNQYYYIYIDLNADGFFTSTERLVSVTGSGSVEGNLVIPEGTLPTLTRMRIVNSKATIPDSSCGAAFDGETEDYTVEIQDYCDAGVSVAAYLFVNRFRFAGQIDNTSQWSDQAWSGSTDYSQLIAQATPGSTYSFTITPGYTNPSYKPNFSIKIWVDYNRDGIFDDATEKAFFKENNTAEVTASLSIPASAVAGKARMRVMLFRSGEVTSSPEPCFEAWTRYSDDPSVWVFGEVEDYSIQINQSGSGRVATVNTYTDPETHEHAEAIVGGIQFYPNPATGDHGTLKVEVEMLQDIRISLMDLTGKVYNSVLHPQVSGLFSAEVGLNGLPEGVYIVKVDGSTFTKGIKLIRK